jgi:hypothetical protein
MRVRRAPRPPPPVFDQSLVQVLLGALVAERVVLTTRTTVPSPEYPQLHLGRPWPRPIVERQGDRIGVESDPGRGTAFFFTLPAISEA